MIITPEQFPDERRHDPKRRAEAIVFDTLAQSQRAGHAIYEWSAPGRHHQTDFACWLEGIGRFAIEVKGGTYTLHRESDQWHLRSPDGGLQAKSSPLRQAADAAMDLYDEIEEQTGYKLFVIPVVVFPDMAPDQEIDRYAGCTNVKVIWGTENFLADLAAIASQVGVNHPPKASHIRNEVQAVTVGGHKATRNGKPRSDAHAAPPVEQLEVSGVGSITIHYVEHMHVQRVEKMIVQQAPDTLPDCGF